MTPEQMEQDFRFLRGQVQRLSRLIDALESSPLLIHARLDPAPEVKDNTTFCDVPLLEIRTLEEVEKEAILNAHKVFEGNINAACEALKIGKTTYYRKMKEYKVCA
jgi:transcriptional regulator of acetoin/glycerol metabolism